MTPIFSSAAGGFHRAAISSSQEDFIRLRRISLSVGILCEKTLSVLFDTATVGAIHESPALRWILNCNGFVR